MTLISLPDIEKKIGRFVKEIFVSGVQATPGEIRWQVRVDRDSWLMNDHFPGTSIIQCFFQGAMLLYWENKPDFDPDNSLFFLGDLKIKYRRPIFLNDIVNFQIKNLCFMGGVLLFSGECFLEDGTKSATISGSLSSKPRTIVGHKA